MVRQWHQLDRVLHWNWGRWGQDWRSSALPYPELRVRPEGPTWSISSLRWQNSWHKLEQLYCWAWGFPWEKGRKSFLPRKTSAASWCLLNTVVATLLPLRIGLPVWFSWAKIRRKGKGGRREKLCGFSLRRLISVCIKIA